MDIERIIISELIQCEAEERIDALIELEKIKFSNGTYNSLLQTIRELALLRKNVDIISIYQTNQNISAAEISKISGESPSPAYLFDHIKLLYEKKYRSEIIETVSKGLGLLKSGSHTDDIDDIKNGLIADLSGISLGEKAEFENISEYKRKIEEQLNSKSEIEGFSWGISDLDRWTSGIVIPRVYVIGGLKKSGKTRFLIHTIKSILDQGTQIVFESMEMPAYEVTKLLHSTYTGFNDIRFRSSSFMSKEEIEIFRAVNIDEKLFGLECKVGLKIDQLLSRIRRYAKMGFKIVAIDYLQRISHDRNRQAQELEDITIKLADSCRQNNIALILLSQLNAAGEKETPNMGHLKGCVEENTLIDGKPIKEYYFENLKKEIKSFDTETKKIEKRIISQIIDSGTKECFEITTKSGKKIIVSGTTKLYTGAEKWEDVADIKEGMEIVVDTD